MTKACLTGAAGKRLLVNNNENTSSGHDLFEKPEKNRKPIWEEQRRTREAPPESFPAARCRLLPGCKTRRGSSGPGGAILTVSVFYHFTVQLSTIMYIDPAQPRISEPTCGPKMAGYR
jgi:hypothetical protein